MALQRPGLAQAGHRLPDGGRGVADAVGVVQEQDVEVVDAAALEAALGRLAQVARVLARRAVGRGEAREALGAVALRAVEVVADRADERVRLARRARPGRGRRRDRPRRRRRHRP